MHLQAENHDGEREFTRGQKWVAAHEKEVIRQGAQVPGVPRPASFNSEDTQGRAAAYKALGKASGGGGSIWGLSKIPLVMVSLVKSPTVCFTLRPHFPLSASQPQLPAWARWWGQGERVSQLRISSPIHSS